MTEKPFADHFSSIARSYAAWRPRYPDALFEWLASIVPRRGLAWDCAAGNGQATAPLARFFERVIGTDASAEQIGAATPHERVEYRVAPAHASGIEGGSADLVTVAQALHWFDLPAFYAEATRVLAPDGVLAVWTYGIVELRDAPLDRAVTRFYREVVGPHWPPERRHVEEGYRSLPFPFEELRPPPPPFAIRERWSLADFLGYAGTWSATVRYREAHGHDPVPDWGREIAPLWGGGERDVFWPLGVRAGRPSRQPVFGRLEPGRRVVVRPSAYGLVSDSRGLLAVVRTSGGLFLPGGGIEAGETPEETIVRELREECGLAVRAVRPVAEAVQRVFSIAEDTQFEKPSVFFEAVECGPREAASEPDHALQWMPVAEAAARLGQESHAHAVAKMQELERERVTRK